MEFHVQEKKEYISCLKSSGHQSDRCRQFSKKYLECRMERFVSVMLVIYFYSGNLNALFKLDLKTSRNILNPTLIVRSNQKPV